jgi:hypothetical protein
LLASSRPALSSIRRPAMRLCSRRSPTPRIRVTRRTAEIERIRDRAASSRADAEVAEHDRLERAIRGDARRPPRARSADRCAQRQIGRA